MSATSPSTARSASAAAVRFQRPNPPALSAVAAYYAAAEEAKWFSNFGPCHELLVERLEVLVGQGTHAVPVGNCTLGLMVALRALTGEPDGQRDLVITPSYTFAGRRVGHHLGRLPAAVRRRGPPHVGARPRAARRRALGARPPRRGRHGGLHVRHPSPACRDPRLGGDLRARAGVPLLVDSAAGFGAERADGRWLGAQGHAEVFSFHATKPFSVGEAGVVTTRDPALRDRLRRLVNFGFDEQRQVSGDIGINAKLAELPAATALAVLDGFHDVLAARRASAGVLREALEPFGFRFQEGCEGSTWQAVCVQAPKGIGRPQVLARATSLQVEIRAYFEVPLHQMGAFRRDACHGDLAVTDRLAEGALSLPMADDIATADLQRVLLAVTG